MQKCGLRPGACGESGLIDVRASLLRTCPIVERTAVRVAMRCTICRPRCLCALSSHGIPRAIRIAACSRAVGRAGRKSRRVGLRRRSQGNYLHKPRRRRLRGEGAQLFHQHARFRLDSRSSKQHGLAVSGACSRRFDSAMLSLPLHGPTAAGRRRHDRTRGERNRLRGVSRTWRATHSGRRRSVRHRKPRAAECGGTESILRHVSPQTTRSGRCRRGSDRGGLQVRLVEPLECAPSTGLSEPVVMFPREPRRAVVHHLP